LAPGSLAPSQWGVKNNFILESLSSLRRRSSCARDNMILNNTSQIYRLLIGSQLGPSGR